jgi:hypothetical protein
MAHKIMVIAKPQVKQLGGISFKELIWRSMSVRPVAINMKRNHRIFVLRIFPRNGVAQSAMYRRMTLSPKLQRKNDPRIIGAATKAKVSCSLLHNSQ